MRNVAIAVLALAGMAVAAPASAQIYFGAGPGGVGVGVGGPSYYDDGYRRAPRAYYNDGYRASGYDRGSRCTVRVVRNQYGEVRRIRRCW